LYLLVFNCLLVILLHCDTIDTDTNYIQNVREKYAYVQIYICRFIYWM